MQRASQGIRLLLVLLLFAALAAGSATVCHAKAYPFLHRGARPLGMGGAFTALADDENALFYNPAGLSYIQRFELGVVNPMVDISEKSIELLQDAEDADTDEEAEVADLMRDYVGEHQHLAASLYPHVGFRVADVGVMIGGLYQVVADADVRNPAFPEAHLDLVKDTAVLGGVGFKVPVTGLRLGAALKWISRESLEEIYTAADIANNDIDDQMEDDMASGSGVSLDIGAIYALSFIPIFDADLGLVVQNLPQMDMGDAKDLKTQVNMGLALRKSLAKFKLAATLDYMDLAQNFDEDNDIGKRLHLGLELKTPFLVAVRIGSNQGYFAWGATLDLRVLRLDFASYTEEVGAYAGQRDDHRYVGQISLGW